MMITEFVESEPRTNAASAIYIRGLSITTLEGKCLLKPMSFAIPAGQLTVVIGASGCGKSTLLRALAGLNADFDGEVFLQGHPVMEMRENYPRTLGYLPQFTTCHGRLTVGEIMEDACNLRLPASISPQRRKAWCQKLIDLTDTGPLLEQTYQTLSGGQMRRVALLEELMGNPKFLFLDELTSGLDPYGDYEMMNCLRILAESLQKNIVLVSHNVENLKLSHRVLLLHQGRLCFQGSYQEMLLAHQTTSVVSIFGVYQESSRSNGFQDFAGSAPDLPGWPQQEHIIDPRPIGGCSQFLTLVRRQSRLFFRDRPQLYLHAVLMATFPLLVTIFGLEGLPQIRVLDPGLGSDVVRSLAEKLDYLGQAFQGATLVSGLAMFQVILLALMASNNGAREIAKEQNLLRKELRAGLAPWAYVASKVGFIFILCLLQALVMALLVKQVCGFPGNFLEQFSMLFLVSLAISATCLAISAACATEERASLLAIYLVGLQLPLSGAILALPGRLSPICHPFIAAYWGWSGYIKTLSDTRYYDLVHQSTNTAIADYGLAAGVLLFHVMLSLILAHYLVSEKRLR